MADEVPAALPSKIHILSLNCWGLKFISELRSERLTEIGVQIAAASPQPDIVGLQECWTQEDFFAIRRKTERLLPYGKFYHSGIFGGGLVILSRWPIEESNMLRYPLNGRPAAFYRGDWFVGKGVASARIRIGPRNKDVAEIFCTHLHAPYEKEPFDSYLCHRTAQAWEIAKKMRHAAERGHIVIGLGDFNMRPLSLAHQIIETQSPLRDIWRVLHPDSSLGAAEDLAEQNRGVAMPSAMFNLIENGATCDSVLNTWRWDKPMQKRLDKGENIAVEPSTADPHAKRLDYIFVSHGERIIGPSRVAIAGEWGVESVKVGMTERHPTLYCSLSDHFSVEATISRTDAPQLPPQTPPLASNPYRDEAFLGMTAQRNAAGARPNLPLHIFDDILEMTRTYDARERRQRTFRIAHFWVQLAVTAGCLVAVWWSPRSFVAFLLMLLSSLGLAAGVVDGLMGFLFVGSELRALREFEWEVRNAREKVALDGSRTGGEKSEGGVSGDVNLAEEEA